MEITEVVKLAAEIEQSLAKLRTRSTLVVMFVDLVGSTEFKAQHPKEEEWLPRLAKFLLGVTRIVEAEGRVVKYIGDEVMAVFEGDNAPLAAEQAAERVLDFCRRVPKEKLRAKIAVDYGSVSLLDFSPQSTKRSKMEGPGLHEGDPNGLVVDRCARIMTKGAAGAVLCSAEFRDVCHVADRWGSVGSFQAKGLTDPIEVFSFHTRDVPDLSIVDDPTTLPECKKELAKVQTQLAELKRLNRHRGR